MASQLPPNTYSVSSARKLYTKRALSLTAATGLDDGSASQGRGTVPS
jgi:hypothetical protein